MVQTTKTQAMRGRLEDGSWDTIWHHGEALVRGSDMAENDANIRAAVMALVAQKGLVAVKLDEMVKNAPDTDPKSKTYGQVVGWRRVDVIGPDHTVTGVFRKMGVDADGHPLMATDNKVIVPEGKIAHCLFDDFRHNNAKLTALQPNVDVFDTPEHYVGFAPPLRQVLSKCATCPQVPAPVLDYISPKGELREETITAESQGVKLAKYPTGGALGSDGSTAQIYDAINMPQLLGIMPQQPVTAADGRNANTTGIQTVGTTVADVLTTTVASTPVIIGGVGVDFAPSAVVIDGYKSANRDQQAGQGGQAAENLPNEKDRIKHQSNDVAGRDIRFDGWPMLKLGERSFRDVILVPATGWKFDANNRVVNDNGTPFGNNEVYYAQGIGSNKPSVTGSYAEQEQGHVNHFIQGQAGKAEALDYTNSYAMAYMANQLSVQPQLNAALKDYYANPADGDKAQKALSLLNYQSNMYGVSNFTVNADVKGMARTTPAPNVDQLLDLNPAERVAYQKESILYKVEQSGITVPAPDALPTPDSTVHTITKAQYKQEMLDYYTQFAKEQPMEFKAVFKRQIKYELDRNPDFKDEARAIDYDRSNPEQVAKAAAAYVDTLTVFKPREQGGMADEGFGYSDDYFLAPRSEFNDVELGKYKPKDTSNESQKDVTDAMTALAGNDAAMAAVLKATKKNRHLGQAIVTFDTERLGQPSLFGDKGVHWDRKALLAKTHALGYSDDLIGTTITNEETKGQILALDKAIDSVASSADLPGVIAARRQDFIDAATNKSGKAYSLDGNKIITQGGPANNIIYALACEDIRQGRGNNTTLKEIDQAFLDADTTPDKHVAKQQIESWQRSVDYVSNIVMKDMVGHSVDEIRHANAAISLKSPGVAANQGKTSYDDKPVDAGTRQVPVDENATILFKQGLAPRAQAAQAFMNAAIAQPETDDFSPKDAFFDSAQLASKEDQFAIVKAALGNAKGSHALVAAVSGGLSGDEKTNFDAAVKKPTADNAKDILTGLAKAPAPLDAGVLKNIASSETGAVAMMHALSQNPEDARGLVAGLKPDEKASIQKLAGQDKIADMWAPVLPQTVTDKKVVHHQVADLVNGDQTLTAHRDAALESGNDRKADLVRARLNDPVMRDKAYEAIARQRPDISTTAVVQTLVGNPELLESFKSQLKKLGDEHHKGKWLTNMFDQHPQGHVAGVLGDMVRDSQRNDQDALQRDMDHLQKLMQPKSGKPEDVKEAEQLVQDISLAMRQSGNGAGAEKLAATFSHALDEAKKPDGQPLDYLPLTADQFLNGQTVDQDGKPVVDKDGKSSHFVGLYSTVVAPEVGTQLDANGKVIGFDKLVGDSQDFTDAEEKEVAGLEVLSHLYTHSGWIIPFIPFIVHKPKTPEDTPIKEVPCTGDCGDETRIPPPTYTPPPTTPPTRPM